MNLGKMAFRLLILSLMALGAALIVFWCRSHPLPRAAVASPEGLVDVRRCAECHEEICTTFYTAPHSRTLTPAAAPHMLERFAGQQARLGAETFRYQQNGRLLHFSSDQHPARLTVDWIFGSGHHALTPVSVLENPQGQSEAVQLHVSWFPGHGMGPTPGSQDVLGSLPSLGIHQSHAETIQCFGCHSSHLPTIGGKIQFDRLVAGIHCTRCHAGLEQHMGSDGEVATQRSWTSLTALESINRCGQCHRRADEFTPDELIPGNKLLIRFAPVGLAQSRCFQIPMQTSEDGEIVRLDCLTCHDPHQPARTDSQFYVDRCLSCHGSDAGDAAACTSQPMTSQCLICHMPKVQVQEGLKFTDHWIRIRTDTAAADAP